MAKTGSKKSPKILNKIKRKDLKQVESERPTKRLKALLEEDDTSDGEDSVSSSDRGVLARNDNSEPGGHGFKVNHEFARRFEHNKKREELQKRE